MGVKRIGHWCLKDWEPAVLGPIYELYMLLLILVFPLVAMTFAYVSICRELWTVMSTNHQMTSVRCFPEITRIIYSCLAYTDISVYCCFMFSMLFVWSVFCYVTLFSGLFSVQFYTKTAVLNGFVEF